MRRIVPRPFTRTIQIGAASSGIEIGDFEYFKESRLPGAIDKTTFSSMDRIDDPTTNDADEIELTQEYIRRQCGETPLTYGMRKLEMVHNNNSSTNYVRAVNDYSTSMHEIWSQEVNDIHKSTAITSCKHVHFSKLDSFLKEVVTAIGGCEVIRTVNTDYHGEEEPNNYTTYSQRIIVLSVDGGNHRIGIEGLGSVDTCFFTVFSTSPEFCNKTIDTIIKKKKKFRAEPPRKEKTFHTISAGRGGFSLEDLKLNSEYDDSIVTENYNDDFQKVDEVVKNSIHDGKRGLILLHGIPGSGKTSYIKHLITSPSERKIVYVPTHLTSSIASPTFISFVKSELHNSVLVIEDAEQVLLNRDSIESQKEAVSNILNMTDGILAEALNLLIICTFNTDMENLDKALLRKGRLLVRYHFDKLSKEKTNTMCMRLYGKTVDKEMTLADIYGLDYDLIAPETPQKRRIGFIS